MRRRCATVLFAGVLGLVSVQGAPRVYFTDYNAESINIQVSYWYAPVDSWAFMEHSERVNYRIMEEFERLGLDFAFPSKTSFVKKPNSRGTTNYAA